MTASLETFFARMYISGNTPHRGNVDEVEEEIESRKRIRGKMTEGGQMKGKKIKLSWL